MLTKLLMMNFAVLIVPGVNFYMVIRNTLAFGSLAGFLTSLGAATAISSHACFALFGSSALISQFPGFISYFKIIGSFVILFIAVVIFYHAFQEPKLEEGVSQKHPNKKSLWRFYAMGFSLDLLNPYVFMFYLSAFTSLNYIQKSNSMKSITLLIIYVLTALWFCFVSIIFSQEKIRCIYMKNHMLLSVVSSFIIAFFSYELFSSK